MIVNGSVARAELLPLPQMPESSPEGISNELRGLQLQPQAMTEESVVHDIETAKPVPNPVQLEDVATVSMQIADEVHAGSDRGSESEEDEWSELPTDDSLRSIVMPTDQGDEQGIVTPSIDEPLVRNPPMSRFQSWAN